MGQSRVLVVAATHGNERNAPWLFQQWRAQPALLNTAGLALQLEIGNPDALAANRRYLDRDLNRCFTPELLGDPSRREREVQRARDLVATYGPNGTTPCAVALDLHSTTSAMGNSLVVYGRRPADLALAAGMQARLGLPVYLHEADAAQTGFLVERWPAGLVIEVGPVPQGLVSAVICRQTQLALEAALDTLAAAAAGRLRLPQGLQVHRHHGSLDLPRDADGTPGAALHPQRQHRDWTPLKAGDPLFWRADGSCERYQPDREGPDARWPVFINEAAYGEKGIALSLCTRERWPCEPGWAAALAALL
ncbi:MAG: aspartoacylase [Cyanobacteria bacterium M_surface_10_m2_179]|nr:aspartoacylase [Cyanobacteria bacterium M_surface_10_m2_179]